MHDPKDPLGFIPHADHEYIRDRVPPPAEPGDQTTDQPKHPKPRITRDGAHTAIAGVALACLTIGAAGAFGLPYGSLVLGALLLSGVIYARVFAHRQG